MAIVINGSGTVTGLSVGGLPDGTVDAGTLATDSVTAAKIAANSVDSSELIDGAVDDSHMASISGRKNILINGGFDVWQRGTSFTVPDNDVTYTTDRWAIFSNGSNSRVTTKEEAVINNKVGNSIKVALTTPNARDRLFRQKIEDLKQFSSQTLTLSYYAKASTSTEYKVETRRYYGTGGSADSNDEHATHTFTTSWQKFTTTFTVPNITGDTFGANNSLWIMFKVNTIQTHDVYLANVQLERGSTATEFEHRSYGEELALCQRYYYKTTSSNSGGSYQNFAVCSWIDNAVYRGVIEFPVTMRTRPTFSSTGNFQSLGGPTFSAMNAGDGTTFDRHGIQVNVATNQSAGQSILIRANNDATAALIYDAGVITMANKMNITQAQYINVFDSDKKASVKATIDNVEMFVPLDEGNRHYAEILKQVADGTITIAEAD